MFGHQDDSQQPQAAAPWVTDVSPVTTTPSTPPVTDQPAAPVDVMAPTTDQPTPEPVTATSDSPAPAADTSTDDLLNIKQQALQQLSPLVGQLEQSPEEKFRTTMMMIQASDDRSLVGAAYEAAKQIPDEKARAQALLDIVNEINYFTQH